MLPCVYLAATLAATSSPFAAEAELSEPIRDAELQAHVYRLASPEFLGRRGPGAVRASEHVADAFRKLGLKPAFGDSYFQAIPWLLGDGQSLGRNVAAILPGSDPVLRDEWIILSAHFDHLGVQSGALYPGADDNAASVAMLLEVAEQFALRANRPKRSIMFVSFDLEEQALQGSTHFAAHSPRDFSKLKAFLVADLLGRSMANLMDEYAFVLGSESATALRSLVTEVKPESGLTMGRLGADLVGTRSDYGPFRDRKIPFLFFTTGTHPDYHRPTDLPERIDYVKLGRISRWIAAVTERLANDEQPPVWSSKPDLDITEAQTVLVLLERVLECGQGRQSPLTGDQRTKIQQARDRMKEIVARGRITPEERSWLVWMARWLMISVF